MRCASLHSAFSAGALFNKLAQNFQVVIPDNSRDRVQTFLLFVVECAFGAGSFDTDQALPPNGWERRQCSTVLSARKNSVSLSYSAVRIWDNLLLSFLLLPPVLYLPLNVVEHKFMQLLAISVCDRELGCCRCDHRTLSTLFLLGQRLSLLCLLSLGGGSAPTEIVILPAMLPASSGLATSTLPSSLITLTTLTTLAILMVVAPQLSAS
jgi:hypothetical protein